MELLTEKLSEMVARPYLRTPRSVIVDMTLKVRRKRHEFMRAVSKGLIPPETPPALRRVRRRRFPGLMGMDPVEDVISLSAYLYHHQHQAVHFFCCYFSGFRKVIMTVELIINRFVLELSLFSLCSDEIHLIFEWIDDEALRMSLDKIVICFDLIGLNWRIK